MNNFNKTEPAIYHSRLCFHRWLQSKINKSGHKIQEYNEDTVISYNVTENLGNFN